jgi:hypothetical protein
LVLTATLLRIDRVDYTLVQLTDSHCIVFVLPPPPAKDFYDVLPERIICLELPDALHRVQASQRNEWVTTPFGPGFEAAQWFAAGEVFVLAPPAPVRESRSQKFCATPTDAVKEAWLERTRFGILEPGIEVADNEAPYQILTELYAISSDSDERFRVHFQHSTSTQQPYPCRAFGDCRRKRRGLQGEPVVVVQEQRRVCLYKFGYEALIEFRLVCSGRKCVRLDAKRYFA